MNAKYPVTRKQRRVLLAIKADPDATDKRLMAALDIRSRSHLNYFIRALIKKGLIIRVKSRPRFKIIEQPVDNL